MVDSTTAFITRQSTPMVISGIATMDQNATKTMAIPSGGRSVIRIGVPTIDSSTLTFEVQPFPTNDVATGTFRTLKDDAGNTITVTASTGGFVVDIPELAGAYAFKIVTAAQTSSARLFEVQCVGPYPTASGSNKLTIEGGSIAISEVIPGTGATDLGKAEDSVAGSGDTGVAMLIEQVASPSDLAGNGDYALPQMSGGRTFVNAAPVTGAIVSGATTVTPVFAAISAASNGNNTLVAADATKKIRVFALSIVVTTAVGVTFQSAAGGTALTGAMPFAANGGYVLPFNPSGWFETVANQLLNMNLSSGVQVSGHLLYGLV